MKVGVDKQVCENIRAGECERILRETGSESHGEIGTFRRREGWEFNTFNPSLLDTPLFLVNFEELLHPAIIIDTGSLKAVSTSASSAGRLGMACGVSQVQVLPADGFGCAENNKHRGHIS